MDDDKLKTLVDTIRSLDASTQRAIHAELGRQIYGPDGNPSVDEIVHELRESRFAKGLVCPYCGKETVQRHGFYQTKKSKRQRYLCTSCNDTFSDLTCSPMAGTHYPEKWMQYVAAMTSKEPKSLKEIAEELKIHVSTAFFWRHKLATALRQLDLPALSGIIEADETFYLESRKGKNQVKRIGDRPARKRGGVASKRGISSEQVCVLVAVDRNKEVLSRVAGNGRITAKQVEVIIKPRLGEVATLCTDSAACFKKFAKGEKIEHEQFKSKDDPRVKRGIYHIQNVNNYHKQIREWQYPFHGVATKYMDNYLAWHRLLRVNPGMSRQGLKMILAREAYKAPTKVTAMQFRPCLSSS